MKYKYVHVLWSNDSHLKFFSNLVNLINNNLCREEHLFVVIDKEVYLKLSKWENVELYHSRWLRSSSIVRYCLCKGQWVILHGMKARVLLLKPCDYKRIIWRTWGGNIQFQYIKGECIKNLIKRILAPIRKYTLKKVHAIGIANAVDDIDVRQAFGDVDTFQLNYTSSDVDRLREMVKHIAHKSSTINIMVGHSGYSVDNHICVLESLRKFQHEDILIHLIFSYGNQEYMDSVEEYVHRNWPEKIIIHKEFMKLEDYSVFLSQIDIAIFDGTVSYALGNIEWMIEMEKTIVLNRYGIIKEAFDENSVPYVCSDCLATMSLNELTKKRDFSKIGDGMKMLSYNDVIKNWNDFFAELDNSSSSR